MYKLVINTKLSIAIASEREHVAILGNEGTMLGAAGHLSDQDFKAETLGHIHGSLQVIRLSRPSAMAQLTPVVIAPRKELRVGATHRLVRVFLT